MNQTEQEWKEQLKYVNQQGKDNTQKLEEIVSNHSAIRNEQENLQNSLSELESRFEGLELRLATTGPGTVPDQAQPLMLRRLSKRHKPSGIISTGIRKRRTDRFH